MNTATVGDCSTVAPATAPDGPAIDTSPARSVVADSGSLNVTVTIVDTGTWNARLAGETAVTVGGAVSTVKKWLTVV